MVHHDAVIAFVFEARRMLELGNIPKAKIALDAMLEMAEKEKLKIENPKAFQIKQLGPTAELKTVIEKVNEVIHDRNQRPRKF